jgi:hypothetical protein
MVDESREIDQNKLPVLFHEDLCRRRDHHGPLSGEVHQRVDRPGPHRIRFVRLSGER